MFIAKRGIVNYAISNGIKFDVVPHWFWKNFNNGKWEPDTIKFYRKYVSPVKEVIDIGGWIGPSMLAAYSCNPLKIHVIEADPASYQVLKKNTLNNYLNDKVELFNICIGDKNNEIVSFGFMDKNIIDTSVKGINETGVGVITITLMDFLKTKDMNKINIIKIDAEGAEQYMGEGLKYISQFADIIVLISIHTPFWNDKPETANMLMKQFRRYDIFTDKEEPITEDELMEKMLNSSPTRFKDKTGKIFTLILKTNLNKCRNDF